MTPQATPHQVVTPVITHTTTAMSTEATQQQTDTNQQVGPTNPPTVEASLMPIASPAPIYPRDALRDGITGTVELELLVGVDGSVLQVRITRSSGNRQLDNAARDQVLRNWRFQPALRGGIAVQALGRVPIVFTIDGR
jgi:protein TonB